jgi:hypothetical protein
MILNESTKDEYLKIKSNVINASLQSYFSEDKLEMFSGNPSDHKKG